MLIESRELHRRLLVEIDKATGLYLDGLVQAQLVLNEYEGNLMDEEYAKTREEEDNAKSVQ